MFPQMGLLQLDPDLISSIPEEVMCIHIRTHTVLMNACVTDVACILRMQSSSNGNCFKSFGLKW